MSPLMLVLAALVIFGGVFGAMMLASSQLSRRRALAEGELDEDFEDEDDDEAIAPPGRLVPAPPRPASAGARSAAGPAPRTKRATSGALPPTAATDKEVALALALKRGGLAMTPADFTKRARLAALGAGILGFVIGGIGVGGIVLGGALAFGVLKAVGPYLKLRQDQRRQDFVDQLQDALGVMSSGARAGQTVPQTLETLVADFADPMKSEVQEVLSELRMGVPLDAALEHWITRFPSEDLEIAATALVVQRQTGGNVGEILDTLAKTIRERNKLHKQVKALTAQGRASGVVMSLLPVGLFGAFMLISPDRTGLMLTKPLGWGLMLLGGLMIGAGAFFIKKIVTIEV